MKKSILLLALLGSLMLNACGTTDPDTAKPIELGTKIQTEDTAQTSPMNNTQK